MYKNPNQTHGMVHTHFYKCFRNIQDRCKYKAHKDYHSYGGRGIQCLWGKFEDFRDDMYESYIVHCDKFGEPQTTIERVSTNGNYTRENCRWATNKEQSMNKRNTIIVEYKGEIYNSADIEEKFGIPKSIFQRRLRKWKSVDRAVEQKMGKRKREKLLELIK